MELEEEEYLIRLSLDNQFAIDVIINDENNNAIAMIEGLFLNIKHRLSYKRLTEKAVYESYKFLIHFIWYMSYKDRMTLYRIRFGLKPF